MCTCEVLNTQARVKYPVTVLQRTILIFANKTENLQIEGKIKVFWDKPRVNFSP
jgi:hypothetical protein